MLSRMRDELTMTQTTPRPVSKAAGDLYEMMGRGGKLRVPLNGSQITVNIRDVASSKWADWEVHPISLEAFQELAATGFIHKLTEHGEPPSEQRKPRDGWRSGWREIGLDGESADWWVCTQ